MDEVVDRIVSSRVSLLMNSPFFGNLATRLKLVDKTDSIDTAATDGRHFFYNRDFIMKLDKEELIFLMAHEIMHVVYDHLDRRGERDHQYFNMAADYVINYELVEQKIGRLIDKVKPLYDVKYRGMGTEEVYDDLLANQAEKEDTLDVHMEMGGDLEGDSEGETNGSGGTANDDGGSEGGMSEAEKKALKDEIKQAIIQAAKAAGNAGKMPASVKRMIRELTNPQLDWRDLLAQQIQSTIKNDYSFSRASRKGRESGFILPGMIQEETIDVCIALDMSGSISDVQGRDFLSEVKGIMELYQDFKIKLWTFDTQVYNLQEFSADNIDEIDEYDIQGGGGTCFGVNWEFMKEEGIEPKKFIMFTDMMSWDGYGDPTYCDTLFINHGPPELEANHGITVKYTENAK